MLNLKNSIAAIFAIGLLTSTNAFAGRYGDAEIRHSQTITQLKQAQSSKGTPCRCDLSERAKRKIGLSEIAVPKTSRRLSE